MDFFFINMLLIIIMIIFKEHVINYLKFGMLIQYFL